MPGAKTFSFVCGQDDFLVGRIAAERFAALTTDITDEFGREVINGFAAVVAEVAAVVNRFRDAVQTVPMFGGRRVIWLKGVNFIADTVTGRAESTAVLLDELKRVLQGVKPEETVVLLSAAPVDRRRSLIKWCEQNADFVLVGGGDDGDEALASVVAAEARLLGVTFGPGAAELLLARVGANTRLLVEETQKLATYAGDGAAATTISEEDVAELTPNVAEGDFFEATEAFFSGDLKWALSALHRHFFAGGDARPVITSLQNRNRLLLQVRALLDSGEISIGFRGLEGFQRAAAAHAPKFGAASAEKSAYNLFAQHPFYLGKLIGSRKLPSLRRFIENQREFMAAFEEIIRRPNEQEEILRDMAVRCLTG